jgi:hypothetical protein
MLLEDKSLVEVFKIVTEIKERETMTRLYARS